MKVVIEKSNAPGKCKITEIYPDGSEITYEMSIESAHYVFGI